MESPPPVAPLGPRIEIAGPLTVGPRPHPLVRHARCLLCGAGHKQFYLAVLLYEGDQPLGELCPRCLREPPGRCAQRVWRRAARAWAEVGAALFLDDSHRSEKEAWEERRKWAEDRRRREAQRRLRLAGPVSAVPEPEAATQAEKEHLAELLVALAEAVGRLDEWPADLAAVEGAGRA
jgi:hypothetical protein